MLTRAAVGTKLRRDPTRPQSDAHPLPPQPYRSLQAYGPADRALFAGRDDDAVRFAQLLDEPGTRLVVLHGESGVGKTSFLRAGVVPFLERECVGYRFARDRSRGDGDTVLLVRATNDPVAQIAAALTAFCAAPLAHRTPAGADASADLPGVLRAAVGDRSGRDALRDALRADPGLLGRLLADLGRVLPFTPVLVIDQAEEVFTLARTTEDEANRAMALEMLRRAAGEPGGFKVVVSLRTEYHGRLTDKLRKGTHGAGGIRDYLLTDFGRAALTEVILRPTSRTPIDYTSDVPADKYRFRFADGVADEVAGRARAHTLSRQDSALPLVQVVCSQLYERVRRRPDRTVTHADLKAIGGVEGGLRTHAEALMVKLFPAHADRAAFRRLLADPASQMFVRQPEGTLTTALAPADFLARHWKGRTPFEGALRVASGGEWRLLRVNSLRIGEDEAEKPYVSLGHDALAGVVAGWADDLSRQAQARRSRRVIVGLVTGLLGFVLVAAALGGLSAYAFTKSKEAEEARDRAEYERYLTTVRSAAAAWDAGRYDEAAALIDAYHPATNPGAHERGHVGFEWHHLWRRTRLAAPLLRGHGGAALLALDPAGGRLATCADDDTVRGWDARSGRPLWRWRGKLDYPRTLSFSPDGRRVACGVLTAPSQGVAALGGVVEVRDGTVVWDAADGEELSLADGGRFDWKVQTDGPREAPRLVVAPAGVSVVDRTTGAKVRPDVQAPKDREFVTARLSADGSRVLGVLAVVQTQCLQLFDSAKGLGPDIKSFDGVGSVLLSPDGARVYRAFPDGTVRVWDAQAPDAVTSEKVGHAGRGVVSPDRQRALLVSGNEAIVVETATGRAVHNLRGHAGKIAAAEFSGDGGRIVTGGEDRAVLTWDARSGGQLVRIDTADPVVSVTIRPDGRAVAVLTRRAGDSQGRVRVWDAAAGGEVCSLPGPAAYDPRMTFTADGTGLVTFKPGEVELWDATTGGRRAQLLSGYSSGEASTIRSVAFNADRSRLLVVDSLTTWVLDAARWTVVRKWPVPAGADGVFSPDGKRVVVFAWLERESGKRPGASVHVCDVDGKAEVFAFPRQLGPGGHTADVSPDGSRLLTNDVEGVRLWDLRNRTELIRLAWSDPLNPITWFSADGHQVFGVVDGQFKTWDGRPVGR